MADVGKEAPGADHFHTWCQPPLLRGGGRLGERRGISHGRESAACPAHRRVDAPIKAPGRVSAESVVQPVLTGRRSRGVRSRRRADSGDP
ncbi:hypothetical protein STRIP9103_05243 [Streptomyces ipomoeae 91-03]|uniref:Uncharacterized protein n=1 Tax=Streptomyces ipomoeae 91-03 TaxID=698759 RepID=L1KX64_9ACTN|nr:hypothetical protein STRIP9103_05243 [Streptomyces ipomoeae 91-03]